VYLHAFETGSEARARIGHWIDYCIHERPHSALGGRTPAEAYEGTHWTGSDWRRDTNLNQAYSSRQTVRQTGTTSNRREPDAA
ncbi:integrase core domain-containing protein, partial [Azospirillum sp. TSO35-2]|uniref:integrase core domain-containing protein n=1 Tax=Azospirillum sp. TSO35-2 TaxID=716796 RepID=UPI001FFE6D11